MINPDRMKLALRAVLRVLFSTDTMLGKDHIKVYRVRNKKTGQWSQGGDLRLKSNWTENFTNTGGKFWTEERSLNLHLKYNKEMFDRIEVVVFGCLEIDAFDPKKTLKEEALRKKQEILSKIRREGWFPSRVPIPKTKTYNLDFEMWVGEGEKVAAPWDQIALNTGLATKEEIKRIKEYL